MAIPSTLLLPLTGDPLIDTSVHGSRWLTGGNKTINWTISDGFFGEFWINPSNVILNVDAALSIFSSYIDVDFQYLGYYVDPIAAASVGSDINVSLDGENLFFSSASQWAIGHFPDSFSDTLYSGQSGDIYLNLNRQLTFTLLRPRFGRMVSFNPRTRARLGSNTLLMMVGQEDQPYSSLVWEALTSTGLVSCLTRIIFPSS